MKRATIKVTTPYGHPDVLVAFEQERGEWYYTPLDPETGRPKPGGWYNAATWEDLVDSVGTLIGRLFKSAVLTGDSVNPI